MRRRAIVSLLLALSAACGDSAGPGDLTPLLEVGTGGADAFIRVRDGDTMLLARGCQGLQHLWVSLRVERFDVESARVRIALRDANTGDEVGPAFDARLRFEPSGDALAVTGIQFVVPDPELVLDRDLELVVQVSAVSSGVAVEGVRAVRVAWGDETCPA